VRRAYRIDHGIAISMQNGYFERLIGSVRRECLHYVAVFGNVHCGGWNVV